MNALSLPEAQLMRMLSGFFGQDRVLLRISVFLVCGGQLPHPVRELGLDMDTKDLEGWARKAKCLFTVVDDDDRASLVVEFSPDFDDVIDLEQLEHRKYMLPLLKAAGIPYVTISDSEFSEMLNPNGNLDIFTFLKDKFEEFSAAS